MGMSKRPQPIMEPEEPEPRAAWQEAGAAHERPSWGRRSQAYARRLGGLPYLIVGFLLLASAAAAQTDSLRIDFGSDGLPTGGGWNNVTSTNAPDPHALQWIDGSSSGIQLDFVAGKAPSAANSSGVLTPPGGSPLASLGWSVDALRDSLYGSGSQEFEFVLTGLEPGATYDFTIVASRLGVSDQRTTRYTVQGAVSATTVLNAAGNATEFVRIVGIAPDGAGEIRMSWRAAPSNDNASSFFYLNALGIDEWAGGSQPPLCAFNDAVSELSRVQGLGPFALPFATYTNDGATPVVQLAALDDATQAAPTWLSLPPSVNAGDPFQLTIHADVLALGSYSATLSGAAAGLPTALAEVTLEVVPPGGLNILFYGNSYSQANNGVHQNVQALAEEAGYVSPKVVGALVGGQTLNFHLTDPQQAAAITQSLQPGEEWSWVVLQGFSLEATVAAGDPAQFKADALAIFQNVRAHSPSAKVCFYQTWARGQGNSFYPNTFADPLDMHLQIQTSYREAADDIDALYGPDTARIGAAGDAVALCNWDPALYDPDLSHPGPVMSFFAANAIFGAIYQERPCDLGVDFAQGTNLVGKLGNVGMDSIDWRESAGLAERVAVPALRRYPGSSEDALLRTAVGAGPADACPLAVARLGDTLTIRLQTPIGLYDGAPASILVDLLAQLPPPSAGELHVGPAAAVVASTPGLVGELVAQVPITKAMIGRTLLVQGRVQAPSANTGSAFTTTDAHAIRVAGLERAQPVGAQPGSSAPGD